MAVTVGFSVAPRSSLQIGLSAFVQHYDSGSALLTGDREFCPEPPGKTVKTQGSPANHKMPLNPRNSRAGSC